MKERAFGHVGAKGCKDPFSEDPEDYCQADQPDDRPFQAVRDVVTLTHFMISLKIQQIKR